MTKKTQQHNKTYTEGDMRVQPHSAAMLWHMFTDEILLISDNHLSSDTLDTF